MASNPTPGPPMNLATMRQIVALRAALAGWAKEVALGTCNRPIAVLLRQIAPPQNRASVLLT